MKRIALAGTILSNCLLGVNSFAQHIPPEIGKSTGLSTVNWLNVFFRTMMLRCITTTMSTAVYRSRTWFKHRSPTCKNRVMACTA